MTKSSIEHIQNMLRTIDYNANNTSKLAVDGFWGEQTENAVKVFQKAFSLPITGTPDFETIEAMENAFILSRDNLNASQSISPFPDTDIVYKLGDYSPIIIIIQVMINLISVRYSNIGSVNTNGRFGKDTEDAIKKLQDISGLNSNGQVDKATWNYIAVLYNSFSKR
ncbi:MAG: peptidoglycan-binding domain-containing protein [Acutalibacteraceae bacterium]|nr:peptidoglycan-binding domain-containing protein [Acutalibacteraceae bacterium]